MNTEAMFPKCFKTISLKIALYKFFQKSIVIWVAFRVITVDSYVQPFIVYKYNVKRTD